MAERSDSFRNRNTYIPPAVQKSIAQHMDRMPSHLKKYQNGGYIPKHAERAMTRHMEKKLPSHLKQYADPYIQQKVVWSRDNNPAPVSDNSSRPVSAYKSSMSAVPPDAMGKEIFSPDSQATTSGSPSQDDGGQGYQQPPAQSGNEYDFIMNSSGSNSGSSFFAPESAKMRIAIFALGITLLIILMIVFFSFLNAGSNKQKTNLLQVAKTQQEIIRLAEENNDKISSRDLKDKVKTLRAVMITSQQETIAALGSRGGKTSPKELSKSKNPQNDTELESARAQARGDTALDELLTELLGQYSNQLQAVYDNGSQGEKELATDAFNQIDLIYGLSQNAASEEQTVQPTQ